MLGAVLELFKRVDLLVCRNGGVAEAEVDCPRTPYTDSLHGLSCAIYYCISIWFGLSLALIDYERDLVMPHKLFINNKLNLNSDSKITYVFL